MEMNVFINDSIHAALLRCTSEREHGIDMQWIVQDDKFRPQLRLDYGLSQVKLNIQYLVPPTIFHVSPRSN